MQFFKQNRLLAVVIVFILAVAAVGAFAFFATDLSKPDVKKPSGPETATYFLDKKPVTLAPADGVSPGASGASTGVSIFGNEVTHDFNNDGRLDKAFLIVDRPGGSGTFYYLVVALNTPDGYVGSAGFFLGDRIAPQTTEIGPGNTIIVNYADRKPGESFAVAPSVGKSVRALFDPATGELGEVAADFEGEADPARMSLGMKTWVWQADTITGPDGISAEIAKKFTLTFKPVGTFSATTDCNGVGGEYSVSGQKIEFTKMVSTLMACADSHEQEFTAKLRAAESFHFTSKGELIFNLKEGAGTITFR